MLIPFCYYYTGDKKKRRKEALVERQGQNNHHHMALLQHHYRTTLFILLSTNALLANARSISFLPLPVKVPMSSCSVNNGFTDEQLPINGQSICDQECQDMMNQNHPECIKSSIKVANGKLL
jgi:hypothetical protein